MEVLRVNKYRAGTLEWAGEEGETAQGGEAAEDSHALGRFNGGQESRRQERGGRDCASTLLAASCWHLGQGFLEGRQIHW